ncbi:16S rRNA (guanine(966)-N(2))-methyltransferase RsmD [Leuconostoc gasicomitatum]|uniref:16S rRNA (guanine(966)-N(2))-methyltransferase RsmD n=1 Tax=Leuconostoc gasicomitatum TaxID=115778 RepID=UPI001CC3FB3C|nr:16S rRNA (guanine(966)-N(2))-methyltransferase RsmD [Leuconostoc gasicomitatum]MBZ5959846.1 16S rRNA (guanine(966)-N(2))-methyltransferase RsmD [Leuconostoc gasicomitatum]MBZ5969939.1 16S rRNA (guanine(966)-N(2))-methyltransferase RsmD [Leuconostoc gasicomitatum]MBZ5993239.1 16S rRNA (guanine(966)-N(2))-methyltransferase RsmD [Leuconostoc gasicomitatum]MBZ5998680.1 16S rRNA (guanine(966)-N(2))-methyltransferase RsmD [Leuconostoc gasicomitatum]
MRVVAGRFRGTRLEAVVGDKTRPTTDKVKEAMFSMLMPYLDGEEVLDLYAGTGGLGIEAVSRGIGHATLVDRQVQAIQVIQNNIEKTHDKEAFTVLKMPSQQALQKFSEEKTQFDLIFLDPPYAKETLDADMHYMVDHHLLSDGAIILAESNNVANLPVENDTFEIIRQKQYGITVVTIYQYNSL